MEIVILGAGISGLSAGYYLNKKNISASIYEKEKEVGGLCRSIRYGDFVFDYGVHVSFSSNETVRDIFSDSVNNQYYEKKAVCKNYWNGYWINHQPQNNLKDLPKEITKKCLIDYIIAKYTYSGKVSNYKDWCRHSFGVYFSENFTEKYTRKFWKTVSKDLTTDWINTRIQQPDLETIIDGALGLNDNDQHYVTTFRYPIYNGYNSYLSSLKKDLKINLDIYPSKIDTKNKKIQFNNGLKKTYDYLISTIPLPEIIKIIEDVPEEVIIATNELKWTSLKFMNFAVDTLCPSPSQWNYYYDEDIPFSRLFYMSHFSQNNAPKNCESIQVEIPYLQNKEVIYVDDLVDKIKHMINKTENIDIDKIKYLGSINVDYGYVIFDKNRKKALNIIHDFLDEKQIICCGRFGEWDYLWSDQALLSGKRAAKTVCENNKND